MLTNNLRTHTALLRDGRKINLTTEQYQTLRLQKEDKKRSDMVTIKDADTKEVLFDGEYGDIKEFQERKHDSTLGEIRWVCSFGTRHPLSMCGECECSKKFGTLGILFKDELKKLGYKVFYDSDITKEMQEAYLNR